MSLNCTVMADNYLERKYESYVERKAAAEKARRAAWKKRMDAYRRKLAETAAGTENPGNGSRAGIGVTAEAELKSGVTDETEMKDGEKEVAE